MVRRFLLLAILLSFAVSGSTAQHPTLHPDDRIRIAEAFRLADAVQEDVWTGWGQVPFAVLLVTPDQEFLIRHPSPSDQFTRAAFDSLLQSDVFVRKRVFSPNLLATFPADNGVPTVVVGQPENTGRSSTHWVVTLLHEHFHQLQLSEPDYYPAVEALDLAGGDESGMWMLNYPFPYDSAAVVEQFDTLQRAALEALQAPHNPAFAEKVNSYRQAKHQLRDLLPKDDYRYLSFQLWQEGVARYTEYKVALAAAHYEPTGAFRKLEDYVPFDETAQTLFNTLITELQEGSLGRMQRVTFYPLGAAEALLLDRANPGWQQRYLKDKFYLEAYFDKE
ncbi:MAG: hypothetical protein ACE5G0_20810 [Rhodothermales bacterium]